MFSCGRLVSTLKNASACPKAKTPDPMGQGLMLSFVENN